MTIIREYNPYTREMVEDDLETIMATKCIGRNEAEAILRDSIPDWEVFSISDLKKAKTTAPNVTAGKPSPMDTQVGGNHYKGFVIQPYEFFFRNNLPFHKSDIIKRICRFDLKGGKGIEDLNKIKHEVDMIIELGGYSDGQDD